MRLARGQASLEYVAVLGLLAAVLAGAAAGVALPDLPRALAHHARVALCVVGGDICRAIDARDAGLAPCVVDSRLDEHETGITILLVRTARGGLLRVERRSDGSAVVAKLDGGSLDATAGFGVALGPVLSAGGSIAAGYGFRAGRAWEVPDAASVDALLADLDHAPPASARYIEGTRQTAGDLSLQVGSDGTTLNLAALEGDVRQAIGRRIDGRGTTLYFALEGGATGPLSAIAGLPAGGHWIAEWRVADPPELTLRRLSPGPRDGQVTETTARLSLADPDDLALAKRLVLLQAAGPVALALGRRMERRLARHGTVETATYAERREDHTTDAGVKLIAGLGADHRTSVVRRTLVDARVLRPDAARRADCLGV